MQAQAGGRGGSHRAGVNKKFLLNTVHGLKSHNKREEEEDCWRQHDLDQKAKGRRLSRGAAGQARRKKPTDEAYGAASPVPEVDTRQFWAEQKRKAMAAGSASSSSVGGSPHGGQPDAKQGGNGYSRSAERDRSAGTVDRASLSDEDSSRKGRKKGERKSKKKTKRKRETRPSGSSSSSGGSSVSDRDAIQGRRKGDKASDKGQHERKRKKLKKKHSGKKKSKT